MIPVRMALLGLALFIASAVGGFVATSLGLFAVPLGAGVGLVVAATHEAIVGRALAS